jgi:hypothetical protein
MSALPLPHSAVPRLLQIEAAHLACDSGGARYDGIDAGDERGGRL